jgi:hypothetical protein
VVLGSRRANVDFKGFFASKVRKFKKMAVLGAGFIRFAHPAGCFALLNIACVTLRPNMLPRLFSSTTLDHKKRRN